MLSAMAKQTIDLDHDLGLDEDTPDLEYVTVKLFKRDWRLLLGLNAFNLSALTSGDASAIAGFILNTIHPDERMEFSRAIAAQPNLTPAKLGDLINKLIEVTGERPTTPPSGSPRGASNRKSLPKSGASSTVRRASV